MELETLHIIISWPSLFVMLITLLLLAVGVATARSQYNDCMSADERNSLEKQDRVVEGIRCGFEIVNVMLYIARLAISTINLCGRNASNKAIINWPLDILFLAVAMIVPLVAERYIRKNRCWISQQSSTKSLNKVQNPALIELDFWLDIF